MAHSVVYIDGMNCGLSFSQISTGLNTVWSPNAGRGGSGALQVNAIGWQWAPFAFTAGGIADMSGTHPVTICRVHHRLQAAPAPGIQRLVGVSNLLTWTGVIMGPTGEYFLNAQPTGVFASTVNWHLLEVLQDQPANQQELRIDGVSVATDTLALAAPNVAVLGDFFSTIIQPHFFDDLVLERGNVRADVDWPGTGEIPRALLTANGSPMDWSSPTNPGAEWQALNDAGPGPGERADDNVSYITEADPSGRAMFEVETAAAIGIPATEGIGAVRTSARLLNAHFYRLGILETSSQIIQTGSVGAGGAAAYDVPGCLVTTQLAKADLGSLEAGVELVTDGGGADPRVTMLCVEVFHGPAFPTLGPQINPPTLGGRASVSPKQVGS